jgi:hypothetical protein
MTKAPLSVPAPGDATDAPSWVERELADCSFRDKRLGQRLRKLLTHMASATGGCLPLACQEWANTKAAYRFLSCHSALNSDPVFCRGVYAQDQGPRGKVINFSNQHYDRLNQHLHR